MPTNGSTNFPYYSFDFGQSMEKIFQQYQRIWSADSRFVYQHNIMHKSQLS